DLAGQIGTNARNQRGRDHRSSLKDIGRRRRHDAVRRRGAPIDSRVEESQLLVLRGWLPGLAIAASQVETGEVRYCGASRCTGRIRGASLGLEKDFAYARGFFLC